MSKKIDWENAPDWATHYHPDCGFLYFDGEQYEDEYSTVLFDPSQLISKPSGVVANTSLKAKQKGLLKAFSMS